MPPPIQSQSGSKAALVTWTVITSILFVVSTVLAIFAHVDRNKLQVEKDSEKKKYESVISDTDLTGDVVRSLGEVKSANSAYQGQTLLNVVIAQRQRLVGTIAGAGATSENDAEIAAGNARAQARDALGAKELSDSLVSAISALSAEVTTKKQELATVQAARENLAKKVNSLDATFATQLADRDKQLRDLTAANAATEGGVNGYRAEKDKQIQDIQARSDEQAKLAQDDMNKSQAQSKELETQIKKLEQVIKGLQAKLRDVRQPVDQVVRQPDAKIIRLGGEDIVYLDLGSGDQVTQGMSFEVFDRIEGIPKPGDPTNDENLPKGKASIEIIKVSPGNSEARIVRQTPGQTVVEGDLLVNVVYDRNTKYNFLVYGKFDLDRNNQATPQDADVIKRLITSWGGNVAEKLSVDTDFVVMGKVPEIPSYTQEELDRPEVQFALKQAQEELAAYDEALAKAIELNIPVLNQNRFLYFTGYYTQSGR